MYGPELEHGRIETRIYRVYDGLELIADKEKWVGVMTIVEFEFDTIKKSTGKRTLEKSLYVTSLHVDSADIASIIHNHWLIESMHWSLDRNLQQDHIKRKSARAARNLDTLQRMVLSILSI